MKEPLPIKEIKLPSDATKRELAIADLLYYISTVFRKNLTREQTVNCARAIVLAGSSFQSEGVPPDMEVYAAVRISSKKGKFSVMYSPKNNHLLILYRGRDTATIKKLFAGTSPYA